MLIKLSMDNNPKSKVYRDNHPDDPDEVIHINPDHIVDVLVSNDKTYEDNGVEQPMYIVNLSTGKHATVKENPEEIDELRFKAKRDEKVAIFETIDEFKRIGK